MNDQLTHHFTATSGQAPEDATLLSKGEMQALQTMFHILRADIFLYNQMPVRHPAWQSLEQKVLSVTSSGAPPK